MTGADVARIMAEHGWSQSELARRAGMASPSSINRAISRGKVGRLLALGIKKAVAEASTSVTTGRRERESLIRTLAGLYAARDADPPSVWVAGRIDECIARCERALTEVS